MSVDLGQRKGSGERTPNRIRPHQHTCTFVQLSSFPSYLRNHSAHSISPSRAAASTSKRRTRAVRRQRVRTSFPLRAVQQYVRNQHDTTVEAASRGKASNQEEKSGASELRSAQPEADRDHWHNLTMTNFPASTKWGNRRSTDSPPIAET